MRMQIATAVTGLTFVSVGVGCWVHYAAGLVVAGVGLMVFGFLTTPSPEATGR